LSRRGAVPAGLTWGGLRPTGETHPSGQQIIADIHGMRILILGAGPVGASVAEALASEANDITLVDQSADSLARLANRLDVRTLTGNAAYPSVLRLAGIEDTDLLIAVTQSDQTNLVACKIARCVFHVPTRIARLRSPDFLDPFLLDKDNFAVDYAICPEQEITDYIAKLIEFPEALQVLEFAAGHVSLVAVRAYPGALLVGKRDPRHARASAAGHRRAHRRRAAEPVHRQAHRTRPGTRRSHRRAAHAGARRRSHRRKPAHAGKHRRDRHVSRADQR